MKPDNKKFNINTPTGILLILGAAIFVFEGSLMYVLSHFSSMKPWVLGVVDSIILTILLYPVMYYFVFRSMVKEITQRKQAEKELLKIKSGLEETVKERTKELSEKNDKLECEIRERVQIQLELKKLARAIHNSPVSVVITDPDGTIEYVNPKFTQVTGYTSEEAIGQNPRVLKSGRQSQEFYKNLWDTIKAGKVWRGDFSNKKKSGEIYWESASIAPVLDDEGKITHFVAVKEDITEQKAANEALDESMEKLQVYADKLQKSNEMKELLLDIITHDLKNPVGVIDGFTGILLSEDPSNEIYQTMADSSGTILKVIENATALAGVALGDKIEKQKINLAHVLKDIKLQFDQSAEDSGMEIQLVPHNDVYILANPIISEVFKNYLSNAVKYAKSGKKIIMEIEETPETVKVCVKDFGTTIPEENRKAIFHRQTRLESGQKGRGLGLAIVKRIAEEHGAKIWVEPNTPGGNCFYFEIEKYR